jgi:hypothetical protein
MTDFRDILCFSLVAKSHSSLSPLAFFCILYSLSLYGFQTKNKEGEAIASHNSTNDFPFDPITSSRE